MQELAIDGESCNGWGDAGHPGSGPRRAHFFSRRELAGLLWRGGYGQVAGRGRLTSRPSTRPRCWPAYTGSSGWAATGCRGWRLFWPSPAIS
jgi:hypothetical protein